MQLMSGWTLMGVDLQRDLCGLSQHQTISDTLLHRAALWECSRIMWYFIDPPLWSNRSVCPPTTPSMGRSEVIAAPEQLLGVQCLAQGQTCLHRWGRCNVQIFCSFYKWSLVLLSHMSRCGIYIFFIFLYLFDRKLSHLSQMHHDT